MKPEFVNQRPCPGLAPRIYCYSNSIFHNASPVLNSRGGALRYQMATHCQTAARSGSGERQNIGAVNSFEGKKGGGQLQTKN